MLKGWITMPRCKKYKHGQERNMIIIIEKAEDWIDTLGIFESKKDANIYIKNYQNDNFVVRRLTRGSNYWVVKTTQLRKIIVVEEVFNNRKEAELYFYNSPRREVRKIIE